LDINDKQLKRYLDKVNISDVFQWANIDGTNETEILIP
jgi:hypothetical protein